MTLRLGVWLAIALCAAPQPRGLPLVLDAPLDREDVTLHAPEVLVRGLATPGARVSVNLPGRFFDLTAAEPDGSFAIGPLTLDEGANHLTIIAGHRGLVRRLERSVVLASIPPELTLDPPWNGLPPVVARSADLEITGSTGPRLVVRALVGDHLAADTSAGDGRFRLTLPGALREGGNSIAVKVATDAGLERSVTTYALLDTTPPVLMLRPPYDADLPVVNELAGLAGWAEPGAELTVRLNGQVLLSTPVAGGEFVLGRIPLGEGPNELVLTVRDAAGNSAAVSRQVLLDTTPPAVALLPPLASGAWRTTRQRTVVEGLADAGSVVVLLRGRRELARLSCADGHYRFDPVLLDDGDNDLWVAARDAAGNESRAFCRVTVDRQPPELRLTSPGPAVYLETPTFSVAGETEPGASVQLAGQGRAFNTQADAAGRFQLDGVPLSEGLCRYDLAAADDLGNGQVVHFEVTGRLGDPWLELKSPLAALVSGRPLTVAFEHEAGCNVRVTLDGVVVGPGTTLPIADADAVPRATTVLPVVVGPGPHDITVAVVSPSGLRRSAVARSVHVPGPPRSLTLSVTPLPKGGEGVLAVQVADAWGKPVPDGTPLQVRLPDGVAAEGGLAAATQDGKALFRLADKARRARRGVVVVSVGWLGESAPVVIGGGRR
ncbi:MAG: hypothetical protein HYU66_05440 [Armatimonadetes bacterium]|nr:hypothetical protein [Armatimonadota bacterium]